jgi:hypothetical protein
MLAEKGWCPLIWDVMSAFSALSVVSPAGDMIRSGKKTLEIRQWKPDSVPLLNLVIVQNQIRLSRNGVMEDPHGKAVALVDVTSVADWKEEELEMACGSYWAPGIFAWRLSNVRPLDLDYPVPARLRIYTVDLLGS